MKKRKIAVVHDVLLEYGGAEKVLLEILRLYPDADLFTLFFNKRNEQIKLAFKDKKIYWNRSKFLSGLSRLGPYFSVSKLFSWYYFFSLDFSHYDLVISSSGTFNAKCLRVSKHKHLCYLFSPPKYLYEEENELGFINAYPWKLLFFPIKYFLRKVDAYFASKPDLIATNSKTVGKRIFRYYGRRSIVIYPPVEQPTFKKGTKHFFVAHSRLVKQKGLELIVQTCTRFSLPLVVIGEGYQRKYLERIAGPTIFFTGFISREAISRCYAKAYALLYSAVDEDFGLVPVEAQAHGLPVICFRSGALMETVVENKTGYFFCEQTSASLLSAIAKLLRKPIDPADCRKQSGKFSRKQFKSKITQAVSSL
ncbi:MAG: glycosyltransferase family 4 protein [Candidatus Pacebacteria bacterium]|nr:glycosyltransferase family 4 protein [Candidatus Paceibacterota bacterium]